MRWARPLGMPILTAPSARASEKAHTCGQWCQRQRPLHTAPALRRLRTFRNRAQGTSRQGSTQAEAWAQGSPGLKGPERQ